MHDESPWLAAVAREPTLAVTRVQDYRLPLVNVLGQDWGRPNTPRQVLEFVVPHD